MSPSHERFTIHSLDKRALEGPGILPNGPENAPRYMTRNEEMKRSISVWYNIMEETWSGQGAGERFIVGISIDGRENFLKRFCFSYQSRRLNIFEMTGHPIPRSVSAGKPPTVAARAANAAALSAVAIPDQLQAPQTGGRLQASHY
jgi:hypothetical protein